MRLNHINIPVENVAVTSHFFEQHFNFKCTETKGDNALVVLNGDDNFTLVLMSQSFNRDGATEFPSAFHIGFLLASKEEVTNQYNKLKMADVQLKNEPANMRGVFGFYFMAPGNILVEVSSDEKSL